MVDLEFDWKNFILMMAVANTITTIIFEKLILQRLILLKKCLQIWYRNRKGTTNNRRKIGKSFL